jgi:hypothetical protein
MRHTLKALPVVLLLAGLLGACSDNGSDIADATTTTTAASTTTTTLDLGGELDAEDFLDQLRGFEVDGPIEAAVTFEVDGDARELTFTYINEDKFSLWSSNIRLAFDRDEDLALLCKEDPDTCVLYSFDSPDFEVELARIYTSFFTPIGLVKLADSPLKIADADADADADAESTFRRETRSVGSFDGAVCYKSFERGQEDGEICIDPSSGLIVLLDASPEIVATVESVSDEIADEDEPFSAPVGFEVVAAD